MLLVGLTGGIGSGKTSVSRRLAAAGAVVVDADAIVHELQQPGQQVFDEMVELFGDAVLAADGSLNRQAVADIVFHDKSKLDALGKIVHPRVTEEIFRRIGEQESTDNVVILDIPLLTEAGWDGMSGTIVVDLDPDVAVARLMEFRGFSEGDARARISNQASREERLAGATWVIDNGGNEADLDAAVDRLWAQLVTRRDEAGSTAAG